MILFPTKHFNYLYYKQLKEIDILYLNVKCVFNEFFIIQYLDYSFKNIIIKNCLKYILLKILSFFSKFYYRYTWLQILYINSLTQYS